MCDVQLPTPSENKTNRGGTGECDDIYHCCLELFTTKKWLVVWPLLKWDYSNNFNNNKPQNTCNDDFVYYQCDTDKMFYLFDNRADRDNENLEKAIKYWKNGFASIYEHYPFGIEKDARKREYYFILNSSHYPKYLFKCKNETQRRLLKRYILKKAMV